MEAYVVQVTDKFGNKIDFGYEDSIILDTPVRIGDAFWMNHPTNDEFSGEYEVVGVIQSA